MRRILFALIVLAEAARAGPPPAGVVVSPAPDRVAVTVYRDPDRTGGGTLNLGWLRGFALVSERRRIALPPGASIVRFEGVAAGIVPVSAIVTGLPGGVAEKNRDASLLSPAALIEANLGRAVTIRRTDRTSGRVREVDAIVRAGAANGGVVLETREGIEALRCAGLAEQPVYAGVPAGLSAQPVLSVATRSAQGGVAEVTLTYLAAGFDWQASYVARIAPDGRTLDLFAWLTLANGNDERFADAELQTVAGRLNRDQANVARIERAAPLRLRCWPDDVTRDAEAIEAEDIVVTAMRVAAPAMVAPPPPPPPPPALPPPIARQEELGDLKLYRLPERVTIGARSQKQVALLRRGDVPFATIHAFAVAAGMSGDLGPAAVRLRMRNAAAAGLGLPLPSGSVVLLAERRGGPARLVGGGRLRDLAVDEDVTIPAGTSPQVRLAVTALPGGAAQARITNANPRAVQAEVRFAEPMRVAGAPLPMKDGLPVWITRVPANGTAAISWRWGAAAAADARPAPRR
ncbi:MAG: hypothetical protein ABW173_06870 [Sphingomonas sp.]